MLWLTMASEHRALVRGVNLKQDMQEIARSATNISDHFVKKGSLEELKLGITPQSKQILSLMLEFGLTTASNMLNEEVARRVHFQRAALEAEGSVAERVRDRDEAIKHVLLREFAEQLI